MTKRSLKLSRVIALSSAILFLWFGPGQAQDRSPDTVKSITGVTIETSVDRAEIFIGDLVNYSLKIIYDSTLELIPPPLGANLGAFEVKDYQADIITHLDDGRIQSENKFVISTFTTGDYFVPPVPVVFKLPDGSSKILLSEMVPIKVKSMLTDADGEVDIKPLAEPYEFKRDYTRRFIIAGVILVLIALAGYLWWRRSKRAKPEVVDLRPAWEIAFEQLARLEQGNYIKEGRFKHYYLALTETARWYLGRMYQQNVLDMTTEEFLTRFEAVTLPGELYDDLLLFLNHADLVKFARFTPEEARTKSDFELVHRMIEAVRSNYIRQQALAADQSVEASEVRP